MILKGRNKKNLVLFTVKRCEDDPETLNCFHAKAT